MIEKYKEKKDTDRKFFCNLAFNLYFFSRRNACKDTQKKKKKYLYLIPFRKSNTTITKLHQVCIFNNSPFGWPLKWTCCKWKKYKIIKHEGPKWKALLLIIYSHVYFVTFCLITLIISLITTMPYLTFSLGLVLKFKNFYSFISS